MINNLFSFIKRIHVKIISVCLLIVILMFSVGVILEELNIDVFGGGVTSITGNAVNSGNVGVCINDAPVLDLSNCNSSVNVDELYLCSVSVTDVNGDSINYSDDTDLFNINSTGGISFTPTADNVGDYSITISIDDNSGCSNSEDSGVLNLEVIGTSTTTESNESSSNPTTHKFNLDLDSLDFNLKDGEESKKFVIKNEGDGLSIDILIVGLDMLELSEDDFFLSEGEEKEIEIIVNSGGLAPGVYVGEIIVEAMFNSISIPVVIDFGDSDSIELNVEIKERFVEKEVVAEVAIFTIGEETDIHVCLNYNILDLDSLMFSEQECMDISIGGSFYKIIDVTDLPKGDYVFNVIAEYNGKSAIDSDIFGVVKGPISEEPRPLDTAVMMFDVVLVMAIMLGLFMYYKNMEIFLHIRRCNKMLKSGEINKAKIVYNKIRKLFLIEDMSSAKSKKVKEGIVDLYHKINNVKRK